MSQLSRAGLVFALLVTLYLLVDEYELWQLRLRVNRLEHANSPHKSE